jgi:hypothetical protein
LIPHRADSRQIAYHHRLLHGRRVVDGMGSEKKDKSYGLDPEAQAQAQPAPEPASPSKAKSKPGLPLEGESKPPQEPEPEPPPPEDPAVIRALDVCPNCGSPLGGVDSVVCLRCGFDLKTLKVIKTETGGAAVPAEEKPKETPILSGPGMGDLWLPAALAGVCLVLLALGYLSGAGGLVTVPEGQEVASIGARMVALLKMLLRTMVLALAGLGGLTALASVLSARLGDVKLAAVRMLGIMAAVALLGFFDLNSASLEWTMESLGQAVAFMALSMALFRFSARDAATLLGVTVIAVVVVLLLSALVQWAITPGSG